MGEPILYFEFEYSKKIIDFNVIESKGIVGILSQNQDGSEVLEFKYLKSGECFF